MVPPLKPWLVVPMATAAILRFLHLAIVANSEALSSFVLLDSVVYITMADQVRSGDILIGSEPYPLGPLYAYLLALLRTLSGESHLAVFVLQAMVGIANVGLVALIARRLGSRLGACIAGVAFAFYGPSLLLEFKLLGETLALLMILLAIWLLGSGRSRGYFSSGLALAAACLLRPDTLLFLGLALFWLLVCGQRLPSESPRRTLTVRWRRTRACLLGVALVLTPIALRNLAVTGEFLLISGQGAITFYQGNNPRAEGTFSIPEGFSGNKAQQEQEAANLAERALGRPVTHQEASSFWMSQGFEYLWHDLGLSADLIYRKFRYWIGSGEPSAEYSLIAERCMAPSLHLAIVPFGLFLGAWIVGIRRAWKKHPTLAGLLLLLLASNLMTGLIFFVTSRYRLAAAACLAVFLAPAVDHVLAVRPWQLIRRGMSPRVLARLLPFASGAVLCLVSLLPWSEGVRYQAAHTLHNFGVLYYQRGRFPTAISYLLTAVDVRRDNWQFRESLAHAFAAHGDTRAAIRELEKVQKLNPNAPKIAEYLTSYRQVGAVQPILFGPYRPLCEL